MEFIGPYALLSPLGEGGMGTVYRAEHSGTGVLVALKTLRTARRSLLRSLRREIQALRRLQFPGIVRILDEGVHQGLPWYAMELVTGKTLAQWRQELSPSTSPEMQTRALPWWTSTLASVENAPADTAVGFPRAQQREERAALAHPHKGPAPSAVGLLQSLELMQKLCVPLSFLHGEGLVHRDLKPDNILVRPGGEPVLVDFGISSFEGFGGDSSRETLVVESGISGTAYYMSPEQVMEEPLDARSDLYSLGVILYELLTGQRPFRGDSAIAVMSAHLHEEPVPPVLLQPSLPEELSSLILGLLTKKRGDRRPGYTEDLSYALQYIAHRLEEPRQNSPEARTGLIALPSIENLSPRSYLYRPSLSGRDESLATLRGLLAKTSKRQGGIVLLGGESGVGKTRLAKEFSREAARQGVMVLGGWCQDEHLKTPLSAFVHPLQEIADAAREGGAFESERLFGPRGKVLSLFVPAIAKLPGQELHPPPAELPLEAAQRRLYSYLGETLFAFTQERPLLLVLDDLQWADELSMGFLHFLRRGAAPPFLVLGTYRSDEVHERLDTLRATSEVTDIKLGRLEEGSVVRMIGEMLAMKSPPALFGRFLTKQSEGNPFFVAEYLRAAVERGLLFRDPRGVWQLISAEKIFSREEDYDALPLPKTLLSLVDRRLSALSPEMMRVLEIAAVFGREVPLSLLDVALRDVDWADDLRELEKRHLLEETPGSIRFTHDKVREVIHTGLSAEARRGLHLLAAQSIAALPEEERTAYNATLGDHWEQAGEPEKARPCYLAAAVRATARYDYHAAEKLYLSYLRLSTTPNEESIDARNDLGEHILRVQGRIADTKREHMRAIEESRAAKLPRHEARSLSLLGAVLRGAGEPDGAKPLFEQALQLAWRTGDRRMEGICLCTLGILYMEQGQLERARELFTRGLALLRELGERHLEGVYLGGFAVLHSYQGYLEEARTFFERAILILREVGDLRIEAVQLGNLAVIYKEQERFTEAHELYQKALALSRQIGYRRGESLQLGNMAELFMIQGQLAQSRAFYQEALSIAREVVNPRFEAYIIGSLAEVTYWETGDLAMARELCLTGEELSRQVRDHIGLGKILCTHGHLLLWEGESPAEIIDQVRAIASKAGVTPESELGKKLSRLERAASSSPLFRGVLVSDIPVPLREYLIQTGQLVV